MEGAAVIELAGRCIADRPGTFNQGESGHAEYHCRIISSLLHEEAPMVNLMDRRNGKFRILGSLLLGFGAVIAFAPGAFAGTIVSVTGTGTGEANFALGGSDQDEVLEASWTILGTYFNVSIAVDVGANDSSSPSLSAYLTTAIGPTETAADEIAGIMLDPAAENETDTLFSGLTLGPGTYYLVLTGGASDSTESVWWGTDTPTAATTGDGVTFGGDAFAAMGMGLGVNGNYPPASDFNNAPGLGLLFDVTGDATPEPSSFSLILIGGPAGFWLWKRRRSRLGSQN
jgi:hypothetical protein